MTDKPWAGLVHSANIDSYRNKRRLPGHDGRTGTGVAPQSASRGRLRIRVKSGHKASGTEKRARLVISPTMVRLARPAILA
jgi:hypothetical protein